MKRLTLVAVALVAAGGLGACTSQPSAKAVAKDVVQSTLIKAVRAIGSYRGEAAIFTWICQICRRQIVDYLRAHRSRSDRFVMIDDSPELRAVFESIEAPPDVEPSHRYGATETRQLIQTVLDRLPAHYGDVLEWKYVEGHTVEEIGARLGLGYIAAQSTLARARAAFRDALGAIFGADTADVLAAMRGEG